ncbi:NAD(P)-binding protein [Yamadazyma tenuis]|uniref:NAD(P)-binding protein n=1 Tax=Candida tenuis (strain ATCC 10573 / BCRC 21748 / CBS 615 / JCM 9827 / NBRC 10315 / NRRL Y-1498 / VKM Y-70) TaxID=590646 RepID=G3BAP5_CANTC|nr:NAD(P)-binding protein [Yamadazyma tenuis ATCC 10573]EGV62073.1 NAD(P)-binding protein [Yamadazyma tenuis ATCC 10573]WEJ93323.1 NAD(P)-binding protein [Yamadazyma tenuis]
MSTYLITGANRGIGLALFKQVAAKSENTVIVTVRDETKAEQIKKLGYNNVHVIVIDMVDSPEAFKAAFKNLPELAPNGFDVVIHNAGVSSKVTLGKLVDHEFSEFQRVWEVNFLGAVKFFRSIIPTLDLHTKPVKALAISSLAGTISQMIFAGNSYGASKAALNYLIKELSLERKERGDIFVPINPGVVETDMTADMTAEIKEAYGFITAEECAAKLWELADKLTLEDSGKFLSYDGSELAY